MVGQFMAGSAKDIKDIIVLNSRDTIKAKILEVSPTEVKYKKLNYLNGPTFVIYKSDISTITYGNGDVESFVKVEEKSAVTGSTGDIASTNTDIDTVTTASVNTADITEVSTSTPLPIDSVKAEPEKEILPSYPMLDRVRGQYVLGDMTMDKKALLPVTGR